MIGPIIISVLTGEGREAFAAMTRQEKLLLASVLGFAVCGVTFGGILSGSGIFQTISALVFPISFIGALVALIRAFL